MQKYFRIKTEDKFRKLLPANKISSDILKWYHLGLIYTFVMESYSEIKILLLYFGWDHL